MNGWELLGLRPTLDLEDHPFVDLLSHDSMIRTLASQLTSQVSFTTPIHAITEIRHSECVSVQRNVSNHFNSIPENSFVNNITAKEKDSFNIVAKNQNSIALHIAPIKNNSPRDKIKRYNSIMCVTRITPYAKAERRRYAACSVVKHMVRLRGEMQSTHRRRLRV
jgi:hypothetical protein